MISTGTGPCHWKSLLSGQGGKIAGGGGEKGMGKGYEHIEWSAKEVISR